MSKNGKLMALFVIALCSHSVCAQSLTMSIDGMFALADEQSTSIAVYDIRRDVADEALKGAKAQRLPDLTISASASYLGDGRLWDRNFGDGVRVDMPHFGNNFALEARQVVYAGGAVGSSIKQAELGKRQAELDWAQNRQEIRFMLVGSYLDLYKLDNQMKVLQKNIELTEQILADMIVRKEQGTVLKNDITRYELQLEQLKLQLTRIQDNRAILNHQLVTTLHLPKETVIVPDTMLLNTQVATLAESDWQEMATNNNIALQQAQTAVLMNEQQVRQERAGMLPSISVVAADHLDGPITIEVPVLDNNFNYWYVGIGIDFNIASLYKSRRKVKQARLNVNQAREQYLLAQEQVENAVQAGYTNFLTAFTDLHTQENSVRLADEHYSVTSNRYRNGMALLADMLDASYMKISADLGLVEARINVIYNYYKMKYITHTL